VATFTPTPSSRHEDGGTMGRAQCLEMGAKKKEDDCALTGITEELYSE